MSTEYVAYGYWLPDYSEGDLPVEPDVQGASPTPVAYHNSGPDAQLSFSDFMRRFGPKKSKLQPVYSDDEEAIALILCAIAAGTYH